MQQNPTFDDIPSRGLIPVSAMLGEFSFFDKLIEDVLDLLPRARGCFEIFKNPLQIHPAVGGLLNIPQKILFIKVRL